MDADYENAVLTQKIILAAAQHDLQGLRGLLRSGSANVQDSETGYTPLHAAIAACELSEEVGEGAKSGMSTQNEDVLAAEKTLQLLFENGAIWNDLDAQDETAGCLALRLGLKSLYESVVEAGVRAELLLMRLDEYAQLMGDDESQSEAAEEESAEMRVVSSNEDEGQSTTPALSPLKMQLTEPEDALADVIVNSATYLHSALKFQDDKLTDSDANGVMMAWETEIMRRSAQKLLPQAELAVLNIGHGMGIVDNFIQELSPATHHIIEAHPDVLEHMSNNGWKDISSVIIHASTWQEAIPSLVKQNITFDAIYFDTFAEDYKAFRELFTEHIIALLKPKGRFGFFHGLGGDRQVCYDVYTKVSSCTETSCYSPLTNEHR